jgi:hypothetical protein
MNAATNPLVTVKARCLSFAEVLTASAIKHLGAAANR